MRWTIALLLILIACAQAPEPAIAPPTIVTLPNCESVKTVGEGCQQTCECLRPAECINQICTLTQQPDGYPCVESKQCLSGYCTDGKTCGGPDAPKTSYDCRKECDDTDYDGTEECHTVCRYR